MATLRLPCLHFYHQRQARSRPHGLMGTRPRAFLAGVSINGLPRTTPVRYARGRDHSIRLWLDLTHFRQDPDRPTGRSSVLIQMLQLHLRSLSKKMERLYRPGRDWTIVCIPAHVYSRSLGRSEKCEHFVSIQYLLHRLHGFRDLCNPEEFPHLSQHLTVGHKNLGVGKLEASLQEAATRLTFALSV